jgi:hypothetical protein
LLFVGFVPSWFNSWVFFIGLSPKPDFASGWESAAVACPLLFLPERSLTMPRTIFRQVGSVRRTPRPRISRSTPAPMGGFDSLLAKLGLAQQQLKRARKRR